MIMKTKSLLTAVLLSLSTIAFSQTSTANREASSTQFNSNWYLQIQAGASHTLGEAAFGKLISPAIGLFGGYNFTPLWGLRFGITGWESKGAWVNPLKVYKYNYIQGNIDATLDLGNLFRGYNIDRIVNPYIFAGIGLNGAFNNDDAIAIDNQGYKLGYLWKKNKINIAGRAGLGLNFKLNSKLLLNLEANANVLSDKYNSKKAGNADWQFNLLAGITFKFGKSGKKSEPIVYETTTKEADVQQEEKVIEQPTPVITETKESSTVTTVTQRETITQNIFFKISSANIRDTEKSKIDSLINFLKANSSAKVTICGYADKETGNARFNKELSKKRAEAVATQLKAQGISDERIKVDYKGDTVQPFPTAEQNRVSICIAE